MTEVEERLARLETEIANLKEYVTNDLKERIDRLYQKTETSFRWMMGTTVSFFLGILGLLLTLLYEL